jgi:diguanylate cyclase (GGDEF)-like protein
MNDPYIVQRRPKSILCVPIIHKRKVSGILYLENNLATNAFTKERLGLLRMLSSQAAISIENARLYHLATTDRMTRLFNNTHFQNILESQVKYSARNKFSTSVLMIDVDHFKTFNDTYGHQAGDLVLIKVAETIKLNFREHDICARYGGEEFAVLLPSISLSNAIELSESLRQKIENLMVVYRDKELKITISIGIACIPYENCFEISKEDLLKRADIALYSSKNQGRNRITTFSHIQG